jgi:tetratricopeptide (TPR) repeat protein
MKKLSTVWMVMVVSMGVAAEAAPPHPQENRTVTAQPVANVDRTAKAAEALTRGDSLEALARADEAIRVDPKSGWAHYNRAAALAGLKRTDEAVAAYDEALAKFPAGDARSRSLALWGKAHTLYRVGRCSEASQAFGEYSKVIGSSDPHGTALASERATTCRPAAGTEAVAPPVAATPAKPAAAAPAEEKSSLPSLAKP